MTRPGNRQTLNGPIAWVAVALIISLGLLALVRYFTGSETPAPDTVTTAVVAEPVEAPAPESEGPSTLGARWRMPASDPAEAAETPQPDEAIDIPFDADAIFTALQNVRVDANGNVIVDDLALEALNESLQYGQLELSEQNLADLRELIKVGLPGKAGEQTAQIVTNYYGYLEAKNELNSGPGDVEQASFEQQYRELQQLRERHLGADVAGQLFQAKDARARYMFEAQRIQDDPTLTAEEKLQRVNGLNQKMQESSINVDNWPDRYQRFQEEKRRILEAGLSEDDKRSQVRSLMHRHFQPDEIERINHLRLDSPDT